MTTNFNWKIKFGLKNTIAKTVFLLFFPQTKHETFVSFWYLLLPKSNLSFVLLNYYVKKLKNSLADVAQS